MGQCRLLAQTVAPARPYNRSDWASSFVNVDEELTDGSHPRTRGRAGEPKAPSTAMAGRLERMASGCITPLMATA